MNIKNPPNRPLYPPSRPRFHDLLIDDRCGGRCAHRFEINDPLCCVCSGRGKKCDRFEEE